MNFKQTIACAALVIGLLASAGASAWDFHGQSHFKRRTGFGGMAAVGFNQCYDDYCDDVWNTQFFPSIGVTPGLYWRLIPNLALFVEAHTGYMNTSTGRFDDDRGFLFQTTFGAELHIPIVDLISAFVGFGAGYAYLGLWGDFNQRNNDVDIHHSLHGMNFEFRTGADFYPLKKIPDLGFGVMARMGFPWWFTGCIDQEGGPDECEYPYDDNDAYWMDDDNLPFLFHFGSTVKYKFR